MCFGVTIIHLINTPHMAKVSIKPEPRASSERADGTRPIKIFIEHRGQHPAIPTGIYTTRSKWDFDKGKLKKSWGSDYRAENGKLKQKLRLAEQALEAYASKLAGWDHLQLRDFVQEYIERELLAKAKHQDVAPEASLKVLATIRKVQAWYMTITPEKDIDDNFPVALIRKKQSASCYERCKQVLRIFEDTKGNQHDKYGALDKMPKNYEDISTTDITPAFLRKLWNAMEAHGHTHLTMECHMKQFAACISYGLMLHQHETGQQLDWENNYGWGREKKGKFEFPPPPINKKRAVPHAELHKIFMAEVEKSSKTYMWKLFAVTMFNLNGMDFCDLANLRLRDLEGYYNDDGLLRIQAVGYKRKKLDAHRRKTEVRTINCTVNSTVSEIIRHYVGGRDLEEHADEYVFPILHQGQTNAMKVYNRNRKMREKMNAALKELAAIAGFEGADVTTKVLRHTFATTLKLKEVNIYVIQEMLGHSTVQQTEEYLANCEIEQLAEVAKRINFEIEVDFDAPAEAPLRKAS